MNKLHYFIILILLLSSRVAYSDCPPEDSLNPWTYSEMSWMIDCTPEITDDPLCWIGCTVKYRVIENSSGDLVTIETAITSYGVSEVDNSCDCIGNINEYLIKFIWNYVCGEKGYRNLVNIGYDVYSAPCWFVGEYNGSWEYPWWPRLISCDSEACCKASYRVSSSLIQYAGKWKLIINDIIYDESSSYTVLEPCIAPCFPYCEQFSIPTIMPDPDATSPAKESGIINIDSKSKLYPNPNNGKFTIEFPENFKSYELLISNLDGDIVSVINNNDVKTNKIEIFLIDIPNGVYLYQLFSEQEFIQSGKVSVVK